MDQISSLKKIILPSLIMFMNILGKQNVSANFLILISISVITKVRIIVSYFGCHLYFVCIYAHVLVLWVCCVSFVVFVAICGKHIGQQMWENVCELAYVVNKI